MKHKTLHSLMSELRERREDLGWTQEQLAKRAGFCRLTVSRTESHTNKPSIEHISILAEALGFDLSIELVHRPTFE